MNTNSFEVGEGATICWYSDNKAYTIIKRTATTMTLQRDKATLMNKPNSGAEDALVAHPGGFVAHVSGTQRWEYEADPKGMTEVARWSKKKNKWVAGGRTVIAGRHEHYDYNF